MRVQEGAEGEKVYVDGPWPRCLLASKEVFDGPFACIIDSEATFFVDNGKATYRIMGATADGCLKLMLEEATFQFPPKRAA